LYLVILFPENINEEDKNIRTRNQYIQPVNYALLFRGHYYGFGSQNRSSSFFARNRTDTSSIIQHMVIPNNQHIRFEEELINIDETRVNLLVSDADATVIRMSASGSNNPVENIVRRERNNERAPVLEIQTQQYQIHIQNIEQKINEINSRPISDRIQELFMEIDQLGNYTDIEWFLQLNKRECFLLYGNFHYRYVF